MRFVNCDLSIIGHISIILLVILAFCVFAFVITGKAIYVISAILSFLVAISLCFVFYRYDNSTSSNDLKVILDNKEIKASDEEIETIMLKMKDGEANFDITLRDKTNDNRAFKITFIKEDEDVQGLFKTITKYGIYATRTDGTSIKIGS